MSAHHAIVAAQQKLEENFPSEGYRAQLNAFDEAAMTHVDGVLEVTGVSQIIFGAIQTESYRKPTLGWDGITIPPAHPKYNDARNQLRKAVKRALQRKKLIYSVYLWESALRYPRRTAVEQARHLLALSESYPGFQIYVIEQDHFVPAIGLQAPRTYFMPPTGWRTSSCEVLIVPDPGSKRPTEQLRMGGRHPEDTFDELCAHYAMPRAQSLNFIHRLAS